MHFVASCYYFLRYIIDCELLLNFYLYLWKTKVCVFPVSIQIITKIKICDEPGVPVDVDGICDRIFDSVDKNKDSTFTLTQSSFFLCCFILIKLRLCILPLRSDYSGGVHGGGWEGPLGDGTAQTGHWALWLVHWSEWEETLRSEDS